MPFNINSPYAIVQTNSGSTLFLQSGDYYHSNGTAFTGAIPSDPAVRYAELVIDANGNATAIAGPNGAINLSPGIKTVLFGDSMTDFWEEGVPVTTTTFDSGTGVLTCTLANHYLWTGKKLRLWSFLYPLLRIARAVTVTRISASQFSVVLTGDTGMPASPTAANIFLQGRSENQYISWVGLMQMRLGHRLNIVKNLAQNGESSKGLLARIPGLHALNPSLVLMQATGINDETHTIDTLSEAETNSYNAQVIDAILAIGVRLLLCTITPVYTGEARATKAAMARTIRKNAFLRTYCRGKNNVAVVDSYREIVDPANTTGLALVGMLRNDNIHYSAKGAMKVAKKAELVINAWYPETATGLPISALDSGDGGKLTVTSMTSAADVVTVNSTGHGWRVGDEFFVKKVTETAANGVFTIKASTANAFTYTAPGTGTATLTSGSAVVTRSPQLFSNPLLLTATGGNVVALAGLSGVAASKLQVNNANGTGTATIVGSVPAAQSGFGNEQLLTVTAAALNDRPSINSYGTTSIALDILLNRKYRFQAVLRMVSDSWVDTPISEIYSNVYITWSTGEAYSINVSSGWDGVETPTITENQTWHLRSGEVSFAPPQAEATLSNVVWTTYLRFSGAITNAKTLLMGMSQIAITDIGPA